MNILQMLPQSVLGFSMPWASVQNPVSNQDISEEHAETTEQESAPSSEAKEEPSCSTPTTRPQVHLEPAHSVEDGLTRLKLERFCAIEHRAQELHTKSRAALAKMKGIDELLSHIQAWSVEHPNQAINCADPSIEKTATALRHQGIQVPLPRGELGVGQLGHVFTVLGNQRSLLADELKEHSAEFQQCTSERNTLLQHLMALFAELSRTKTKICSNIRN